MGGNADIHPGVKTQLARGAALWTEAKQIGYFRYKIKSAETGAVRHILPAVTEFPGIRKVEWPEDVKYWFSMNPEVAGVFEGV
jgi:hypothetical protein